MPTLSPGQIYALARNEGLSPVAATTATGIALAESGGRTDAIGDVALENDTWGPSVGLWQIRSLKAQSGTGGPRDATRLTDPTYNARAMHVISGGGQNFGAWTTFTSGAYRKKLSSLNPADLAAGDLSTIPVIGGVVGPAVGAAAAAGSAAGAALKDLTSGGLLGLALKVVAGGAAAALVIVGAVHTVSN